MNLTKSEIESATALIKKLFKERELLQVRSVNGVHEVASENEYRQWERDGTYIVTLTFGEKE